MEKVLRAVEMASLWHDGQKRKWTKIGGLDVPYVVHPIRVAKAVDKWLDGKKSYLGVSAEDLLCVALLHDVLEDTPCPAELIEDGFGKVVLDGVKALTKRVMPKTMSRIERKAVELADVLEIDDVWKVLKMLDRIDNLTSLGTVEDEFVPVYHGEAVALAKGVGHVAPELAEKIEGLCYSV